MSEKQPISAAAVTRRTPAAKAPNNDVSVIETDGMLGVIFNDPDNLQYAISNDKEHKHLTVSGGVKYNLAALDAGEAPMDQRFGFVAERKVVIKYFSPDYVKARLDKKKSERWKKFATFAVRDLSATELQAYINGQGEMAWLAMTYDRKHVQFTKRPFDPAKDSHLWVPPTLFAELPEATQQVLRDKLGKMGAKPAATKLSVVEQRAQLRELLQKMPEGTPGREVLADMLSKLDRQVETSAKAAETREKKLEQQLQEAAALGDVDKIGKIQSKLKMAIEKRQQLVARSDKAAEEFEAVAAE
jgi:hypothetical protein